MQNPVLRVALILMLCPLAGCGGDSSGPRSAPAPDSPAAAIEGMLALAEAGDWKDYVATYYGEKHKMKKPEEQIPQVAAQLEGVGPKLIEMLKACATQAPALSADGTVATWPNKFKLHKDGGKWGFHL